MNTVSTKVSTPVLPTNLLTAMNNSVTAIVDKVQTELKEIETRIIFADICDTEFNAIPWYDGIKINMKSLISKGGVEKVLKGLKPKGPKTAEKMRLQLQEWSTTAAMYTKHMQAAAKEYNVPVSNANVLQLLKAASKHNTNGGNGAGRATNPKAKVKKVVAPVPSGKVKSANTPDLNTINGIRTALNAIVSALNTYADVDGKKECIDFETAKVNLGNAVKNLAKN